MNPKEKISELKALVDNYRYCFTKMVGQKECYWIKCEYCGAEIYEYNPEPRFEMQVCSECGIFSCEKCYVINKWTDNEYEDLYCKDCQKKNLLVLIFFACH